MMGSYCLREVSQSVIAFEVIGGHWLFLRCLGFKGLAKENELYVFTDNEKKQVGGDQQSGK